MFKSAHIGIFENPSFLALLVDKAFAGPPYHSSIPQRIYMPDIGRPVIWQASNTYNGHVYTVEQFRNVLDQPGFSNTVVVANEEDLEWSPDVPAQTPAEFRDGVIANLQVALAVLPDQLPPRHDGEKPQPRRIWLSGGSHNGVNRGWTRQVLESFLSDASAKEYLQYFCGLAVNYYASPAPLDALTYIQWLRGIRKMLIDLGLAHWGVFGKEVGVPIYQPLGRAERSAAQGDAVNFIEEFFPIARALQARGKLAWLKGVAWFAATPMIGFNGEDLGMPYAPLAVGNRLTRAGKKWATG